jgi:integrase
MGPSATGQLVWRNEKPYVRIRIGDVRPRFPIACKAEADAVKRSALVCDLVVRLRAAGQEKLVPEFARRAAGARNATDLEGVRIAVRAICAEEVVSRPQFEDGITFETFATKWTSGELQRLYPKRVKKKRSAYLDAGTLKKWVFPKLGKLPIAAITYEQCEEVLDDIPETKSVYLTRQVAQVIARVFRLSVMPARILKESPIPRGFIPPIMKKRARTYLFPEEDRALLGCQEIYLVMRFLYGMLAREGMRVDEALSIDISDLDLKNGGIELDRNKTDDPRRWALNPSVAEALRLWLRHFHPNPVPSARLFVYPPESRRAGQPIESRHAARAEEFRVDLQRAGCTRKQLFENNEDRRQICIHDLRATFVTIALATDRTEAWVANRTGHRSSKMINEYRRLASCHQELNMRPLDPLTEVIPEFAQLVKVARAEPAVAQGEAQAAE